MMWFFALLIVLLIGAVVVVSTGAGDAMAEEYDDRPDVRVQADGPLLAEDLRNVRFSTAVRGYRASEVDALLARLAREMSAGTPSPTSWDEPVAQPRPGTLAVLPVVHSVGQARGLLSGR